MLTNMLLYLVVIAFVFNLLDPSKLDPSYLLKRGFTTPKNESDQDRAFRKITEAKKQEQKDLQKQSRNLSVDSFNQKALSDGQLSKISGRTLSSSWEYEKSYPSATLTKNFVLGNYEAAGKAKSRQSTIRLPQARLKSRISLPSYSFPSKNLSMEKYDTITVELAPGVSVPLSTIPEQNTEASENPSTTPQDTTKSPGATAQPEPIPTNGTKNN